ncbi:MAG: hypothetical protein HOO06_09240 [Bdellovibrionaceae bacterium]|jgi:hypothetical protein|nr:hypothetical protein [Pseudobdellovibrionaceae bacterium]
MGIRKLEPMEEIEGLDSDRDAVMRRIQQMSEEVRPIEAEMTEMTLNSPANEDETTSFSNRFEAFLKQSTSKNKVVPLNTRAKKTTDPVFQNGLDKYLYQDQFELDLISSGTQFKKVA